MLNISVLIDSKNYIYGVNKPIIDSMTNKDAKSENSRSPRKGLMDELTSRGLVHDVSHSMIPSILDHNTTTFYCGYDPTAPSLHAGSLVPILLQKRLQIAGHRPIVLIGGGTGMIGDPSGKSDERNLLTQQTLAQNTSGLEQQFKTYLDFSAGPNSALMLNNSDWLEDQNLISFLRDTGKHFPLGSMLSRESVKRRLDSASGISFTEFAYQVLQAYDFYHLYKHYDCRLQVGGSDQYGNILSGIDYIRRVTTDIDPALGFVFPLLTTASGEKMGKTAKGALWLDPNLTSPFEFYQYWLNIDDRDAVRFLKILTFLELDEISEIENKFLENKSSRLAQKKLAEEVTLMIHGVNGLEEAMAGTSALFADDGTKTLDGIPSISITSSVLSEGYDLRTALQAVGLADSISAAKRLIRQDAVTVNGDKVTQGRNSIGSSDVDDEGTIFLGVGSRHKAVIQVID